MAKVESKGIAELASPGASEVANAAGVSQSAVSRAFNPSATIAKETRRRILSVAAQLGYAPRPMQRANASDDQVTIAIVMGDITNPFYPEVLEAFCIKFREQKLIAQLYCVPKTANVDDIFPELLRRKLAGVVVTSATLSSGIAQACRNRKLPIVLFNRSQSNADISSVACDNYAGGRQIADFLLSKNHERVAFIAGDDDTSTSRDRERGLQEGLSDVSKSVFERASGGYTYEGGYLAAKKMLSKRSKPDAIFCANDIMALGAIDAVSRDAKLRIPEDIAIVGFDNIALGAWPAYNLTTFEQRVDLMIAQTIDVLKRLIDEPESAGVSRVVKGRLVERGTTRSSKTKR